jgi:hypothetical protein
VDLPPLLSLIPADEQALHTTNQDIKRRRRERR